MLVAEPADGHVSAETAKLVLFSIPKEKMVNGTWPVFLRVSNCAALCTPVGLVKVKLDGRSVKTGAGADPTPEPSRVMVKGVVFCVML
jgi:hypothetical protein